MPIRWRLTLWFSLVLCLTIIISGVVIHTLLQRSLYHHLDEHLRIKSARVHGTLDSQVIPEPLDYDVIHSSLPPVDEFASPGVWFQLIDADGNVVVKSDNLGERELPTDAILLEQALAGEVAIETISASDAARVRVMVSPLFFETETLLLLVGESVEPIGATMGQVTWAILGGVLVTFVLAGISGGVIVRRALAPVESVAKTAEGIESSSDLSRRVGYEGPMDEVGRLATTFDHMIEHLDKAFESQRQFVADASHDLKGPLTVLRANLDLLKRNLGDEERQESMRSMYAAIERMEKMVADLLFLAEVESGPTKGEQLVSLREILTEALNSRRQLAGERSLVIAEAEDVRLRANPERLRRMVTNLVDNSMKYTPEGGAITLSLSRENGWARLQVADTGVGIAPEHLPHIFDRFYMVDKARSRTNGGNGLGLAIVKGIAESHGGHVAVASELGEGSEFTAWLKI